MPEARLLLGVQPDPGCKPCACRLPPPPLQREHRLYQADWLLRFYGFAVDEIAAGWPAACSTRIDPKLAWALRTQWLSDRCQSAAREAAAAHSRPRQARRRPDHRRAPLHRLRLDGFGAARRVAETARCPSSSPPTIGPAPLLDRPNLRATCSRRRRQLACSMSLRPCSRRADRRRISRFPRSGARPALRRDRAGQIVWDVGTRGSLFGNAPPLHPARPLTVPRAFVRPSEDRRLPSRSGTIVAALRIGRGACVAGRARPDGRSRDPLVHRLAMQKACAATCTR